MTSIYSTRIVCWELLDAFPLVLPPDLKSSHKIAEINRNKMLLIEEKLLILIEWAFHMFCLVMQRMYVCVCEHVIMHFCMFLWHYILKIFNSLRFTEIPRREYRQFLLLFTSYISMTYVPCSRDTGWHLLILSPWTALDWQASNSPVLRRTSRYFVESPQLGLV